VVALLVTAGAREVAAVVKRWSKYPAEVRPFMYCLRCAVRYARLSLREERRAGRVVWVCPGGHVVARVGRS
jgi:hypothetical protein